MGSDEIVWTALAPAAFLVVAFWENLLPERCSQHSNSARWACNIFLFVLNSAVLWAVTGGAGSLFVVPRYPALEGFVGELGMSPAPSTAALVLLSLLVLDLAAYWIHRLYHAVPFLWRFHSVHHSDDELDCTTGFRHHVVELAITLTLLNCISRIVGVPEETFAAYGALMMVLQYFQHANVRLSPGIERVLGAVTMTPRMHAIHHSQDRILANMNFGMILNIWDCWFGTLVRLGTAASGRLRFGTDGAESRHARSAWSLLIGPFKR